MKKASVYICIAVASFVFIGLAVFYGGALPLGADNYSKNEASNSKESDKAVGGELYKVSGGRSSLIDSKIKLLLNSKNHDDQIAALKEFSSLYYSSSLGGVREEISEKLSEALKNERDKELARAIALSHSRLYFDKNTVSNLKYAYNSNILSFDDYYGELAHVFPGAPVDVRKELVSEISKSNNRYAADIVANGLTSDSYKDLSHSERSDLLFFLKGNEPIFTGAADSFGYFEAIRYENWLVGVASLGNENQGDSPFLYISEKLLNPTTDPRALVAFAISPYAESLTESQKVIVRWDEIVSRASDFIRKNPNAAGLQQIGGKIMRTQ